ncbi:hypothetical protein C8R43DRAFT_1134176 [Mycena crocata]|nr:hypothetical protein C8R43DRAFT_1134176 [Mycena crocata]
MSSSQYYCNPLFHAEPGGPTREMAREFYLVISPEARSPGRGIYSSWSSAQRVAEGVPRGGATKFATWDQCLPAWHVCCDAGEHTHPAKPQGTNEAPSSPLIHTTNRHVIEPQTPTRHAASHAVTATPRSARPAPASPLSYAVCGGGVVYSTFAPALAQYTKMARAGATSLCTTHDTRYAAHFAAGHSHSVAKAMADADRAQEGTIPSTSVRSYKSLVNDSNVKLCDFSGNKGPTINYKHYDFSAWEACLEASGAANGNESDEFWDEGYNAEEAAEAFGAETPAERNEEDW